VADLVLWCATSYYLWPGRWIPIPGGSILPTGRLELYIGWSHGSTSNHSGKGTWVGSRLDAVVTGRSNHDTFPQYALTSVDFPIGLAADPYILGFLGFGNVIRQHTIRKVRSCFDAYV
jgi:hypothetical protein